MSKRGPLVCQHLENISRDGLDKYQDVIRAFVRYRHGVYALYKRTKLYHVGLAKDLRWRLKTTSMTGMESGEWPYRKFSLDKQVTYGMRGERISWVVGR
jgi:hypothetical protein